jgi:hypothetical protein
MSDENMTMAQVSQNISTTTLKVPPNTPAVYYGISGQNVGYRTPTPEQIESVQPLLNKVSIRLTKLREPQENQTKIMDGNSADSTS